MPKVLAKTAKGLVTEVLEEVTDLAMRAKFLRCEPC